MDKNQRLRDIAVRVQKAVSPLMRDTADVGRSRLVAQCIEDAVMALANDMVNASDG